jgi:hypothetical protein
MYHPIVKEQVLPGQLEELQTNPHPTETHFQSQALILGKIVHNREGEFEGKFANADCNFGGENGQNRCTIQNA